MNKVFEQLRETWKSLPPFQRKIIIAALWAVGLVTLVTAGIRPAWQNLQKLPEQIKQADQVLDDMRSQAEEVRKLRQLPVVSLSQAEKALLDATNRLGAVAQLSMQANRATLKLTKVSGVNLVAWLEEIRVSVRSRPEQVNLTQVEPGQYSGSISLVLAVPLQK